MRRLSFLPLGLVSSVMRQMVSGLACVGATANRSIRDSTNAPISWSFTFTVHARAYIVTANSGLSRNKFIHLVRGYVLGVWAAETRVVTNNGW